MSEVLLVKNVITMEAEQRIVWTKLRLQEKNMSVVLLGIAIVLLAKLPKVSIWVMLVEQGMSEDLPGLQMVTQLLQQEKN